MKKQNQVSSSTTSINLYAPPYPVQNRHRFLPENKLIKIQNLDNNSYLTRQIFHAVKHGYLDVLQLVPKKLMKACLKVIEEKTCFSLLHFAVLGNHVDVVLYLLSFKPDINIVASKKLRPIHLAAQKGHVEILDLLCNQKKLQIDAADDKGQTSLHIACRRGHHEVVKILLNYGASVHKVESDNVSVMHHPVRRNDLEMIQTLFLYNTPLTIKNNNGQNPIMISAIEGHVELFILLLQRVKENGLNIVNVLNEKDNDGNSCISYAVQNKNTEILKLCVDFGADINSKQVDGKTILHTAAIIGYQDLFDLIEIENINLNSTDKDLNTPLHHAVLNNSMNMVLLLLQYGANINICNRNFQTPILLACSEMSLMKNLTEIIKTLINAKANLRIRDSRFKTIFHYIVEKENIEILKYAIRNIPSNLRSELINSQDDYSNSPLHYAAKLGNTEIFKLLLNSGADPKLFAENDFLPLHVATINGHLDIVKLILDFDKEIGYFRDSNESSAIHLAAEEGKYEIFKFLIETGKDSLAKDEFGRNTLMFAARSGCLPIVELLLKDEINVNLYDQMKTTALHQAAGEGHLKVVECLWSHGAVLSDNIFYQSPLDVALINNHTDVARFFLNETNWKSVMAYRHINGSSHIENVIKCNEEIAGELLDKCITENTTNKMDPNYEMKYWFGLIDAGPGDTASISQRYYALKSMAEYKKLNLLRHPLSMKLLSKKWKVYGFGFYGIDLLLYLVYIITMTVYILRNRPLLDSDATDSNTGCKLPPLSSGTKEKEMAPPEIMFTNTLLLVIIMIRMAVQCIKLLGQKWKHFLDFWNIVSWTCNISAIIFLREPFRMPCLAEWKFGPALMFVSYFFLLYYLQHFPVVGIHVIMFQKVLSTVVLVLITFSCVCVGFSFGFFIINSDQEPFKGVEKAMIKVVAMMIGEIDLVTYFIGKSNYMVISLIMSFLFLIIIPIALFNLLIGLAVGDIDNIASDAILEAFKLKIDYVWEVESKLPSFIQKYFYTAEFHEHPKKKKPNLFRGKK